jgi:redox-sensitive bicupin YhaK (pirin superfamily)
MNQNENPNSVTEMMLVPGMTHDLGGGFVIRRLLPYRKKRMVGPFIFFDHMGPAEFTPSAESDIRPHPHIGLSTLTYLFEGRIVHRDCLGSVQTILPGEVNWMTAGLGIVHSERAHADDYGKPARMEGLQFWVALPDAKEDQEPSFHHYDQTLIPIWYGNGFTANVVCGSAFGLKSPVEVSSPLVFLDIHADEDAEIEYIPEYTNFEIAVYVLKGSVSYREVTIEEGSLGILPNASDINLQCEAGTHAIVIGGEPFATPRFIYWNFVATTKEKLEDAKKRWKEDRFPKIPGDDQERIPLGD